MDFLETLKSVGGVKPCYACNGDKKLMASTGDPKRPLKTVPCHICHGTGQIFDLAPLLAKPKELEGSVTEICFGLSVMSGYRSQKMYTIDWMKRGVVCEFGVSLSNLHVIGPQRASNLVYETARQLGGTAVVAEHGYWDNDKKPWDEPWYGEPSKYRFNPSYRLSLPIPPDATVLFVTDRYEAEEMLAVEQAVGKCNMLPYVLALVSSQDIHKNEAVKVICLHKAPTC